MENEKIVAITSVGDQVYGLAHGGHLAIFDKEANAWVVRCGANILSVNKANILKKPVVIYQEPQGRHRVPNAEVKNPRKRFKMITPVNIVIGLLGLGLLFYWFIR